MAVQHHATVPTPAPADVAAPAACLQRYLRNLGALYRCNPRLAERIEAWPFSQCPTLEPTRDGQFTARLTSDSGKPIYIHSRYRPVEESRKLIAEQRRTAPSPDCPDSPGTDDSPGSDAETSQGSFLVGGIGLGYHLVELERQQRQPRLIVAEDDLGLIKASLCVSDLSKPLDEQRLLFLTSADKATVHEVLRPVNIDVLLGLQVIPLPYTAQYHAAFQTEIGALLRDFVTFARLQMVTLLRNARITCKNILFNLPAYLSYPGIEVLKDKAHGYPAILVAAGPSLARNVDQLSELRHCAVVIAVQTVFKQLLARGIPPHFVTSLDFHEISAEFFRGLRDVGPTVLVAEPKATWHVLDSYPGRKHVLHNDLYDGILREAAPARGRIQAGSTVAHLSLYLAQYLGCDPIILVGQDLAFSEGFYYPPGMPIEQIWQPELGRFYTVEMKQWERIARFKPILRTVKDVHGRNTYTDEQLYTYAEQFESDFAASTARVIHACEGGMRLRGTEVMTLREAAQTSCRRRLPPDLFNADAEETAPRLRQRAGQALQRQIQELGAAKQIAVEMQEVLAKLWRLLDRPAEFNRLIVRVDDLRRRISRYEQTYRIVVGVSQLAELRRYSADRRIGQRVHEREDIETARQRLKRDREFVAAFIDGCEYLEQLLPQTAARLEEDQA